MHLGSASRSYINRIAAILNRPALPTPQQQPFFFFLSTLTVPSFFDFLLFFFLVAPSTASATFSVASETTAGISGTSAGAAPVPPQIIGMKPSGAPAGKYTAIWSAGTGTAAATSSADTVGMSCLVSAEKYTFMRPSMAAVVVGLRRTHGRRTLLTTQASCGAGGGCAVIN